MSELISNNYKRLCFCVMLLLHQAPSTEYVEVLHVIG
jgi:hypothetical protein